MTASPRPCFRASAARRALSVVVVPFALALACDDDADEEPPPPPGPVALAFGELLPRGADSWKPGDAEPMIVGCDRRLGVTALVWNEVAVRRDTLGAGTTDPVAPPDIDDENYQNGEWRGDWLFRPPGACGREQCGTLLVGVEPVDGGPIATAEVALATAIVDLAALGDAERLSIRIELRENGTTTGQYRGQPLVDTLEVSVTHEECGPDGEGGAGGAPSTGGTGGTGGTSGTGGGGVAGSAGTGGAPGGAGGESGGLAGEGGADGA